MDIKNNENNKKKMYAVLIIMTFIAIFSLSYYIAAEKIKNNKKGDNDNEIQVRNVDNISVQGKNNEKISPDGKIVFKTKYGKSQEIIIDKVEKASNLSVKDRKNVKEKLEKDGYILERFSPSKVFLLRELDKYSPNKYVLGIKGEYLAIYKTDDNGDMYIENAKRDVTEKKIDNLKEQDINLLTTGNKYFQRNTREEALSLLEDYD